MLEFITTYLIFGFISHIFATVASGDKNRMFNIRDILFNFFCFPYFIFIGLELFIQDFKDMYK